MKTHKRLSLIFKLFILLLSISEFCYAEQVLFAGTGIGSGSSTREISDSESPLAMSFSIDNLLTSDWTLGAEHQRSLKIQGLASNISVTGLNLKFYFIGSTPSRWPTIEEVKSGEFLQSGYHIYTGITAGFAQSSMPLSADGMTPNTTGIGLGIKAGIDSSLTNSLGVRGEINAFTSFIGSGNLKLANLVFGLYWIF